MEFLRVGFYGRPDPREEVSGDAHVVRDDGDAVLLALVDGLGHGPLARAAADAVIASLRQADPSLTVGDLLQRCHTVARATRGCAMTLAHIDASRHMLTWAAVGNVAGCVVRDRAFVCARPMPQGGVVGLRLPKIVVSSVELRPDDLVVLATDGVEASWSESPMVRSPAAPQGLAKLLVDRHGLPSDDAAMIVAHYLGAGRR